MLLERGDVKKLAQLMAQKVGAKPKEWSDTLQRAAKNRSPEVSLPCSGSYGTLPSGVAARALNFMHSAVNGIRPYPEHRKAVESSRENSSSSDSPAKHRSDGACVDTHQYDPIKCDALDEYHKCAPEICPGNYKCPDEFICDDNLTFICDSMRFDGCDPPSAFDCRSRFAYGPKPGEEGGECHAPHKCPNPEGEWYECDANFSCRSNFDCDEDTTNPRFRCTDGYDCHVRYGCTTPAPPQAFDCSDPEQIFKCQDHFNCENPFTCRSHDCGTSGDKDYDTYKCFIFGCSADFDCEDSYECKPPFGCANSFRCGGVGPGDNTNSFDCPDGAGSFDCLRTYQCVGIYGCNITHSCDVGFECGTDGVGFRCVKDGGSGFDCESFNCASGLDFKCEGKNNFECNRPTGFECSAGHVFRCKENFECASHTCSAGGAPCDEIYNFGGQDGPGVFSCDNEFSGCSEEVDCSGATVGYRCINDRPYECGPSPYDCGQKYDSCVESANYSSLGNCASAQPGDPNNHGCPDLDEYGCAPKDQGGPYDCPATYQMLCEERKVFNRAGDP